MRELPATSYGRATQDARSERAGGRLGARHVFLRVVPVPDKDERVPVEIGDCLVLGVLGEGGQSVVYRGWHPRLRTEIAIKKLHTAHDSAESAPGSRSSDSLLGEELGIAAAAGFQAGGG